MATTLKKIVDTKMLKLHLVDKFVNQELGDLPQFEYDPDFDAFFFFFTGDRKRYIVQPVTSWISFLFDPKTLEVFGMQITGFEKSFLDEFPELKEVWRVSGKEKLHQKNKDDILQVFQDKKPQIAQEVRQITELLNV